ncbi:MAG: bifunctional folylpolyglutamate synthase/dihydrofolate synthase [Allosphingosinicella sp.]
MDFAVSSDPEVQRQLDRLGRLAPVVDGLGLERIAALLGRLGNPERALPPVLHVAGTNGKGSTCAFLRAAIEAAGLTAHVYTSPHLVRFNERIRLAGRLVDDARLAPLLGEVLDAAQDMEVSFFEATTAAALLAFSRIPADACVVEVGLGGRLDATNVIAAPIACGIAQLGLDHSTFLGTKLEQIAAEKAGIAKPGVPLVTQHYPDKVAAVVAAAAEAAGAGLLARGEAWDAAMRGDHFHYRDVQGELDLPLPRLPGAHQVMNAALAVAMLRHQSALAIGDSALRAAMGWAEWPARLQLLAAGPLRDRLPAGTELWLDGAHNAPAARAVADFLRGRARSGEPLHIVFGMLSNRDAEAVLRPFRGRAVMLHPVPVPGHEHHAPDVLAAAGRAAGFGAMSATGLAPALDWIAHHADPARPPVVLIMGSLYLAGEALRENEQPPA